MHASPSRKACNGLPSKEPLAYDKAMNLLALITALLVTLAQPAIARTVMQIGAMSGRACTLLMGTRKGQWIDNDNASGLKLQRTEIQG